MLAGPTTTDDPISRRSVVVCAFNAGGTAATGRRSHRIEVVDLGAELQQVGE
jgi:hypothetical protein